jgi:hypothetical protein
MPGGAAPRMLLAKGGAAPRGFALGAMMAMPTSSSSSSSSRGSRKESKASGMKMKKSGAISVMPASLTGAGSGAQEEEDTSAIAVRTNFNPLAVFHPQGITDASGRASIEVKLPDSLTSYRVWAVVVTDKLYGMGPFSFVILIYSSFKSSG